MEWLDFFPPISNSFKLKGAVRDMAFRILLFKNKTPLKLTLPRGSLHPALQESKAPSMLCVVLWASPDARMES